MKLMIIPDIHLGVKSFGKDYADKLNSRIQDQLSLMDYVYEYGTNNNIDSMILLGDVFDKEHPEPILIMHMFSWLSKCSDKFSVDIVLGNHDYKRTGQSIISILDCIPAARMNCKVHKDISTLTFRDLSVTYIPFTDRKQLECQTNAEATSMVVKSIQNQLNQFKQEKNIAVGHLAIEGSFYVGDEIADEHNELFVPTNAFDGFDYTFMGHVHNYQILSKSPHVMHVGSLDKKSFTEGEKSFVVYDSDTNIFEKITLPCRDLVDIHISVPVDITDVNAYVKEQLKDKVTNDSIVRVKIELLSAEANMDKKEINSFLLSQGAQNIVEFVETKSVGNDVGSFEGYESIDNVKAVDMFVEDKFASESDSFRRQVISMCKDIIKEIEG